MLLLLPERRPLGLKLRAETAAEPNKNRHFSGGTGSTPPPTPGRVAHLIPPLPLFLFYPTAPPSPRRGRAFRNDTSTVKNSIHSAARDGRLCCRERGREL